MASDSLTTTEALAICREQGKPMTAYGLIYAGCVRGFSSKSEDGYHWAHDREGLLKYLSQKGTEAPRGWVPVTYLAKKYNLSVPNIYHKIGAWGILTVEFGVRQKIKHVNEKDFEKARIKHRKVNLNE